ncbi:MAG: glycosyl hydrolase [Candidatus Latescibacterota bacterium]
MDLEQFACPDKQYRSIPFWSWNDRLEDGELVRQIREMDEQGWGGFFMHSRVGLITPYLSDEWMDRIRACVAEAVRTGMDAWLYDEDKWPSGFAGGAIPRMGPEYRDHALVMSSERPTGKDDLILAIYAGEGSDWRRIPENEVASARARVVYLVRWTEPMGNAWFNNTTYVDLMNPKVTDAFIASTYQAYKDVVGGQFGKAIPGIFTDEPCYLMPNQIKHPAVAWTDALPERFSEARGYDLMEQLISLFHPVADYRKIRTDFYRTATELFVESYSKRMYAWCDRNHLKYSGHYMCEDNLVSQTLWIGAAMPHYEYMHVPGMDHLSRNIDNLMTAKQVASVAQQLGKERTLSEMYGCSGQHFSFEGQKWIADWHFVNAINTVNPHLSLYTMRGARKRDYPPNIFHQQPWWPQNRAIADYCARASYAITRGKRVVRVLVIHPIESAWASFTPVDTKPAQKISDAFARLSEDLLALSRDHDYGDESIIGRHGKVDGRQFVVGQQAYDLVIVPPAHTLRSTTLDLLESFGENGGALLAIKPLPNRCEGSPSDRVWNILKKGVALENNRESLKRALDRALAKDVDIRSLDGEDVDPIWYHHRQTGDLDLYFLANTDPDRAYLAQVHVDALGRAEEWDLESGHKRALGARVHEKGMSLRFEFEPAGSHLFTVDRSQKPDPDAPFGPPVFVQTEEVALGDAWTLVRTDPNALTLDTVQLKLGEGAWSEPIPTWQAHDRIQATGGRFVLRFPFEVTAIPPGTTYFVTETPEKFAIAGNGHPLPDTDQGLLDRPHLPEDRPLRWAPCGRKRGDPHGRGGARSGDRIGLPHRRLRRGHRRRHPLPDRGNRRGRLSRRPRPTGLSVLLRFGDPLPDRPTETGHCRKSLSCVGWAGDHRGGRFGKRPGDRLHLLASASRGDHRLDSGRRQ